MQLIFCEQLLNENYFGLISNASNAPSEGSIKHGKVFTDGGGLSLNTGS